LCSATIIASCFPKGKKMKNECLMQ
jgi:hypothetical protein